MRNIPDDGRPVHRPNPGDPIRLVKNAPRAPYAGDDIRPFPYGLWVCEDREVIFDRQYRPLFVRPRGGARRVSPWAHHRELGWRYANHDEWVEGSAETLYFYADGCRPQESRETRERLFKVLFAVTDGKGVKRHGRPAGGWSHLDR